MCLKLMLCVVLKLFQLAFPIKRKHLTLTPCLLPKETLQFKSWICLFCDQIKYPYSLCEEVFVYLTQGYESTWNKIDHLCLLRILFYRWSGVLKLYYQRRKTSFASFVKRSPYDQFVAGIFLGCLWVLRILFPPFPSDWLLSLSSLFEFYWVVFKAFV